MSIHNGHRKRLKEKFLAGGLDGFDDHQVLELLLFFALPRVDTNPIAHGLIRRFGTLAAVLDAPREELMKVEGVGENAAALLKMVPQMGRRYLISKTSGESILTSPDAAGRFLMPYFYGERDEVVYMASLDAKCKVVGCDMMARGSVNSTNVSLRKIVEKALARNASAVILAHNHTSGIAIPSPEDEITTRRLQAALEAVEIELIDHIVIADDDFVSMSSSGFFDGRKASYV